MSNQIPTLISPKTNDCGNQAEKINSYVRTFIDCVSIHVHASITPTTIDWDYQTHSRKYGVMSTLISYVSNQVPTSITPTTIDGENQAHWNNFGVMSPLSPNFVLNRVPTSLTPLTNKWENYIHDKKIRVFTHFL